MRPASQMTCALSVSKSLLASPFPLTPIDSPSLRVMLRSLSFYVSGMTYQDLKKLFYSTPCLTTLDICNTPAFVFLCLCVRAPKTPNDLTDPLRYACNPSQATTSHIKYDGAELWGNYTSRNPSLNTTQDDMKVARLDITLPYHSLRACHQAQSRLARG
jgi:hypothetical protein